MEANYVVVDDQIEDGNHQDVYSAIGGGSYTSVNEGFISYSDKFGGTHEVAGLPELSFSIHFSFHDVFLLSFCLLIAEYM